MEHVGISECPEVVGDIVGKVRSSVEMIGGGIGGNMVHNTTTYILEAYKWSERNQYQWNKRATKAKISVISVMARKFRRERHCH